MWPIPQETADLVTFTEEITYDNDLRHERVKNILNHNLSHFTAQKLEFSFKDFFSNWDQIRIFLRNSPYSVQTQENKNQKKLCIWTLFT